MMDDDNFLTYLRQNKPYLYDIETQVRGVINNGGFGEVSVTLSIQHKLVDKSEVVNVVKRLYVKRVENKLG